MNKDLTSNGMERGFTLIELLIVIAIIGIIAGISMVFLSGARQEARNKATLSQISQFYTQMEVLAPGNYIGLCGDQRVVNLIDGIRRAAAMPPASCSFAQPGVDCVCYDGLSSWLFWIDLPNIGPICIDSEGGGLLLDETTGEPPALGSSCQ